MLPKNPPTAEVRFYCPDGSPYEGTLMRMHVQIGDDYPYVAPWVRITRKFLHLNFQICIGTTSQIEHILKKWDSTWDLRTLIDYVIALIYDPDPSLIPSNVTSGTRFEASEQVGRDRSHPPGYDLREKPAANRFASETVHLFHTNRPYFDKIARHFADRFLERATDEPLSFLELERRQNRLVKGRGNDHSLPEIKGAVPAVAPGGVVEKREIGSSKEEMDAQRSKDRQADEHQKKLISKAANRDRRRVGELEGAAL